MNQEIEVWADEHGCMLVTRLPDGRIYEFSGIVRFHSEWAKERARAAGAGVS